MAGKVGTAAEKPRKDVSGFFNLEKGYLGLGDQGIVRDDDLNGLKGLVIVIECRVFGFDTRCYCD